MKALWESTREEAADPAAKRFNASIQIDSRMYRQDMAASRAHAAMLTRQGIISEEDGHAIENGLAGILAEIDRGDLRIDPAAEDIHTFVETELTRRIGDAGKRLHTARSRNDQVATDLRLYLRDAVDLLQDQLRTLMSVLADQAEQHDKTIFPGYTHLQRAQPVTFGHHLLAYAMMFQRDLERLGETRRRLNVSPLGSGALAGTTYPIDRAFTASILGFERTAENSIDAVADRDFGIELLSDLSLIMMHLSRFAEELILWLSREFSFVRLDDAYTTGSSIMPQKKNPDICELVRGKTGRVYGHLVALLTTMKALPLAYNKDMQEDKEALFDGVDTVSDCLTVFTPMIRSLKVDQAKAKQAAKDGFLNATDLADYLTGKGLPFRTSYHVVREVVRYCIDHDLTLDQLPLDAYHGFSDRFEADLYESIRLESCLERRASAGGPSPDSIAVQLAFIRSAAGAP